MEKTVQFKGPMGLIALVAVVGLIAVRVITMGDDRSPELEAAVRGELWSDLAPRLGAEAQRIGETGDFGAVDELTQHASPDAIQIIRIARSSPLMSFASNEDAVVRVDFRMPDQPGEQRKYMRFKRIGRSWRYRFDASVVSYYLNFF